MKFQKKIKKNYIKISNKINEILNNKKYNIQTSIDHNENNILNILFDDTKSLSVTYEIMGIYDNKCNIFSWGDSNLLTNNKINTIIKKIKKTKNLLQNIIIDNKYDDNDFIEKILYYVENNIFFINEKNIINLIYYCCYKTECLSVINDNIIINNKKYIIFYFITDIISV
jgi:hypothetical protein